MSITPSSYYANLHDSVDEALSGLMEATDFGIETFPGNPLIFYESPPTLEHLAGIKVAGQLVAIELKSQWKHFQPKLLGLLQVRDWVRELIKEDGFGTWKVIDFSQFPIPARIKYRIFRQMKEISRQFFEWAWNHENLIQNTAKRFADELLPDFVWKWDGSVDYVQTGLKLMLGPKLTDKEKFKMMCAYCFDIDIEEMYESQEWVNTCKADNALMSNDYVFYWDCYIDGVQPMPPKDYQGSYAKFMLDSAFNVMALGWFLLECTWQERRDFYTDRLTRLNAFELKYLLIRLTEKEQEDLYRTHILDILDNFILTNCFDFALQFWNHVKNLISEDEFVELMRTRVLKIELNFYFNHRYDLEQSMEFAKDVWDIAPKHLKEFFFSYQNGSLIFEWKKWFNDGRYDICHLRDDNLLLAVLSDADTELRRKFWIREWPRLMIGSRPALLRKLMIVCLRDREQIREYERLILDSDSMSNYLGSMFTNFNFDSLNLFLDILAYDENLRKRWKNQMIGQVTDLPPKVVYGKIRDENLNNLNTFLREVDEQSKMKLLSIWMEEWYVGMNTQTYLKLKPRVIYDNMVDVLRVLCDDQQRQILGEKMPSYEEFIGKIESDRVRQERRDGVSWIIFENTLSNPRN